jgi:hypothetical protein
MDMQDKWEATRNEVEVATYRKWHIMPRMSLEIFLWYFWGISCVFTVPYLVVQNLNIRLVELSTAFILIVSIFRITTKKFPRYKEYISSSLMLIVSAYCLALFWPIGGVITVHALGYTPELESYIAPFRRLIIVLILLGTYLSLSHEKWLLRERALLQGFIAGCILTTAWMLIEQLVYALSLVPLNDVIFRVLLGIVPEHTFINLIHSGQSGLSMPLLRASGFGYDPGNTATLVALGWFLYSLMPESLIGKRRVSVSIFLLFALPLSLSRTTIVVTAVVVLAFLGVHLIVGIAQASLTGRFRLGAFHEPMLRSFWRSIIFGLIAMVLLVAIASTIAKMSVLSTFDGIISFIGSGLEAQTLGDQRHWTYFTLVLPALTDSVTAAFLGYGTANVGIAMERFGQGVLPEIEEMAALLHGNWNPESTTIVFALMGGFVSMIALGFCLTMSVAKGIIQYLRRPWNIQPLGYVTILLTPIMLGLGYGFNNTIIYIILFLIFLHIWDPKMQDLR